ncbi:MAG: hypothetical protein QXI95_02170 [Candidatus Micrarchaeaceae archaeon]
MKRAILLQIDESITTAKHKILMEFAENATIEYNRFRKESFLPKVYGLIRRFMSLLRNTPNSTSSWMLVQK